MLLFNPRCGAAQDYKKHFNTSNVTIQQTMYRLCDKKVRISIHLMLLFNNIDVDWSFYDDMHFNTSNVTIQHNII